jgi:hypothetical protein
MSRNLSASLVSRLSSATVRYNTNKVTALCVCPLCDNAPDQCYCQGLGASLWDRLFDNDTVASFTPPWLDSKVAKVANPEDASLPWANPADVVDCSNDWHISGADLATLGPQAYHMFIRGVMR